MKFTEEQQNVLQVAIDIYGHEAQKAMSIGECGELLALYGREAQGRDTQEDWVSEIADVSIMMEQMAKMYGYEAVQNAIDYKLSRLKARLENNGAKFG